MPTEIRKVVDNSYTVSKPLVFTEGKSPVTTLSYTSRKYVMLIICIPIITGTYALINTNAEAQSTQLVQDSAFAFNTEVTPKPEAKPIKDPVEANRIQSDELEDPTKSISNDLGSADQGVPTEDIGSATKLSCTIDRDCGLHGYCGTSADGKRKECICSILYEGDFCETAKIFPESIRPDSIKREHFGFDGEMILNKEKMITRNKLIVKLPGKEKEPDHGVRILAEGSEFIKLFNMLPEKDMSLNHKVYQKCAVIGSSGILLNYEHGQDIDAHDMIMRFNSAPTKGYEKHVGSRTTHRITNTQNWGFKEFPDENLLIHLRAKSAITGIFWNAESKTERKNKFIKNLFAFDPDYVEFMANSLTFLATSGFYGIMIALQRCERVDLYGFHVSSKQGTLYHYYDECDVPANVGRDGEEFEVVKALFEAGYVHFAEDCVLECHISDEACDDCKLEKDFKEVVLPSDSHCDPNRVSQGHHQVPWRKHNRARPGRHGQRKPHH